MVGPDCIQRCRTTDNGDRTRKTDISTGDYVEYAWDHSNRLTAVTFRNSSDVKTKEVTYVYDVAGRRIAKDVDDDGNGTIDRGEVYVYDSAGKRDPGTGVQLDDIVLVYDRSDALVARYLHGPAIDEALTEEDGAGDVLWGLADHLGTIRDWVSYDAGTDTTTVANHLTFTAFGTIASQSNGSHTVRFAFTGREWDADAALLYYRARWYDPLAGRFLGEDPQSFTAEDTNLSRYVGNEVTNATDPSGLDRTANFADYYAVTIPDDVPVLQNADGLLVASNEGGRDTPAPLPSFDKIGPGFPTVLPPPGQTTVVVAKRGQHTFIILLNFNGQTTYFSAGADTSLGGPLVVKMGPYGAPDGAEPYYPAKTLYNTVGTVPDDAGTKLATLMDQINAKKRRYSGTNNNCNTTTCHGLTSMGIPVPPVPIPNAPTGTPGNPGWGPPTTPP